MPTMMAVVSIMGRPEKLPGASYKDDMADRRKPAPQQKQQRENPPPLLGGSRAGDDRGEVHFPASLGTRRG